MTESNERDLELAFLDRMLEEECGGARVPDVADRVGAPLALRALPPRRRHGSWLAAALVLLGIAVVVALAVRAGDTDGAPFPLQDPEPVWEIVAPETVGEFRELVQTAESLEIRLVELTQVSGSRVHFDVQHPKVVVDRSEELDRWIAALCGIGEPLRVRSLAEPCQLDLTLRGRRLLQIRVLGGSEPHLQVQGMEYRSASPELLRLVGERRRALQRRQRIAQGQAATLDELAELPPDSPRVRVPDLGKDSLHHLARFTALRRLEFPGLASDSDRLLDDEGVALLAALPSLQRLEALELPARELTDAGLAELERLTSLRELELLGGGPGLTGAGFEQLRGSGLRRVRLERCEGLTVEGLRGLAQLPELRRLELVTPPWEARGIVAELPSFPDLRELAFQGTILVVDHPALLEPLQRTRIEVLDLSTCPDLDPDALAPLVHLPTLRVLKLARVPVTDGALRVLGKLRQLAEIDVTWTRMTKDGVEALRTALPHTVVRAPVFQ